MNQDQDSQPIDLDNPLEDTAKNIYALAKANRDDSLFLLSLLRNLEQIHRQIRVTYFESALPKTRNDLYQFVRDIEDKGGWPYIERMRLREILRNIESLETTEEPGSETN